MYSFLSERDDDGPNGSTIARDVAENAKYFKKIRFSITGDRYPHPDSKPFLDNDGRPTDDGNYSHRPNPEWFHNRVDAAVLEALELDLIADLILCGPDTRDSRSVLRAGENGGDNTPFLRYIAARYGSYSNVWLCLCNEWDIKDPRYTAVQIKSYGLRLQPFLPYPTPVSVHAAPYDWSLDLNGMVPWNDHVILQYKIKKMTTAADFVEKNFWIGGGDKPVIDDELAYQGEGDGWSEGDVIESHLGAFIGGGYGTTGHKHPKSKQGHYFWGAFDAEEHTAADNLAWMRNKIDESITFWKMNPVPLRFARSERLNAAVFHNVHESFRVMRWKNREFLLATHRPWPSIEIDLDEGNWQITEFDIIRMQETSIYAGPGKTVNYDAPDSRAVLLLVKKQER